MRNKEELWRGSLGHPPLRKILYRIGILAIPIFVGCWLLSTWILANRVPRRPKGVGQNAVFLWAPAVGFPGGLPRRGWWLACREAAGRDHCNLSDINGRTEYEGEFIRYGDRGAESDGELQIDASESADNKVSVGNILVPVVYLKNGKILVPASAYDQAARLMTKPESQTR
jgi:hypothetical protein